MHTFNRSIRVVAAALFSLGLLFVIAGTVSAHPAHAKVIDATPAIGSTIAQPPTRVTVHTVENINPNPKLSNLFVYGPSGELISQGDASVSLSNPKEMSVAIKSDGNGVYVVRWITVSALDGDPDQGAFVFTVKPVAAATPVANAGTSPANTSGNSGTPLWATILIGVVALLIGLGAGLGIGRSTTKSSSFSSMRQAASTEQDKTTTPPRRN